MFKLIQKYPQLLLFGILVTMFSGPGQTFLVSLFIPEMRVAFDMSRTEIAGLYSLATVVSALLLPLLGNLLDRIRLIRFTLAAGVLLALGCSVLSFSFSVISVFIGFLLVRNLGQGTMTLISSTTMARVFGSLRGKALAIANLGYPLSEAIFPFIVSSWILAFGWRSGWLFLAGLVIAFFSPTIFFLLRKDPHESVQATLNTRLALEKEVSEELHATAHWSVREMIRDWRFYVLLTPSLIPPAFLTALFFHHSSLIIWKGWNVQIISAAFLIYAICRASMSFAIGPLVDRFSARKLLPVCLLPLGIGIAGLILGQHIFWAVILFAGGGLTVGLSMTIKGALWAELYGTKYLGSIRGLQASLTVFATAVAPPLFGALLDAHYPAQNILWAMNIIIVIGMFLAWVAGCSPLSSRTASYRSH